jgi:hypothetical protein
VQVVDSLDVEGVLLKELNDIDDAVNVFSLFEIDEVF